jgi:hypothetical protein
VVAQISLEGVAHRGSATGVDEKLGKMPAADRLDVGERSKVAIVDGNAERPQPIDHRQKALATPLAHVFQGLCERTIVALDEVRKQVQLAAAEDCADLDAGDDLDRCAGGGARRSNAGERVVIRDRKRRQAAATGELDNLRRRVAAVAAGGVQMQIDAAPTPAVGERTTQTRERLAAGHA